MHFLNKKTSRCFLYFTVIYFLEETAIKVQSQTVSVNMNYYASIPRQPLDLYANLPGKVVIQAINNSTCRRPD